MARTELAKKLERNVTTMETLKYICEKYNIDLNQESPFKINCCRIKDLPVLFKELGFTKGAEIGVLEGDYSAILCQSNPKLKVYSIDAWEFYPLKNNFRRPWVYPEIYEKAKTKLAQYKNNEIIRKWSMDAVKDFADESLDFVFIDGDHRFEYVANDIAGWGKKVRKGGIIAGHDFGPSPKDKKETFCHVKEVVYGWTASHGIHPWFILESAITDRENGWMWVKK